MLQMRYEGLLLEYSLMLWEAGFFFVLLGLQLIG